MTDAENDKLSVDYDKIFKTNLNHNEYADAVITYWLTPLYANGNRWQPHKAIIVDTDNGYKISDEEFISPNYAIDSVKSMDNQVTIFGYDYETANYKILRNLRLKIK